jgi:hypothetical protein
MTRYWAELKDGVVQRVILCDTPEWLKERLGGEWIETSDPYAGPQAVTYCGPGYGHDPTWPERFAPQWAQPTHAENAYPLGALVWHNGRIWKNLTEANVWEPGVSGWRETPEDDTPPEWVQPTGAHDAYQKGDRVTFQGSVYESLIDANVWSPSAYPAGWLLIP